MPIKIYWDACVFGHAIDRKAIYHSVVLPIIESAKRGDIRIITSTLSCAEMAYLRGYARLSVDKIAMIKRFFLNPYIDIRPVTMRLANKAAEYVRLYGLPGADAVHVATAIAVGEVQSLQTVDGLREDGTVSNAKSSLLGHATKLASLIRIEPPTRFVVPSPPKPTVTKEDTPDLFEGRDNEPK